MKISVIVILSFLLAACVSNNEPGNNVRIVRDEYGTPHIYADDIYGLYFGYGYSIAQDRLFQMEMARRSTQGTVAAVLGRDYIEYDKSTRQLFDPSSIRVQMDRLAQDDKDVFAGYAAGINSWLAEIRSNPGELTPKQFVDIGFKPTDWSPYDVAMIFIGTMNNRYGDFNTELDNASILSTLIELHGEIDAKSLFDLLNPRFTDNAPTTIPGEDWSRPAYDSLSVSAGVRLPTTFSGRASGSPTTTGMSNCFILGKDKLVDGGAVLINGPQFGWFNPSYVYSIGMHGAGIDVVGNTPFGYPMIMFGHNATITWGSTWGASDIVDIYAEQLNPDNRMEYLYKGEFINLEHRVERILVRDGEDIDFDVYRSVHGPIVHSDPGAGIVYAKHRAWDGGELDTLLAWLYATWTVDFDGWKTEAAKSAINVNMYYADVEGNIGYFHGGQFPHRVAGHDNRLPATGDGSMEWQGRQPIGVANPHVLNPVTGYLANWNNKPGRGVMNPDFFFYSWSAADRVDFLHDALASKDKFTADEAWDIVESSSYADVYAKYFLPLIDEAAARVTDDRLRAANDVLQSWNRQSRDADQDGFYDESGTAIFRTFIATLVGQVLADDLGSAFGPFSASGYPTASAPTGAGTNIPTGVKAIVEALEGRAEYDILNGASPHAVVLEALSEAIRQLSASEAQAVSGFRLRVAARPFAPRNFLGIPQAGQDELMMAAIEQNRGTENNMMVMRPDEIIGWEVTPPGQSGFIGPDGAKGAHYDDQFTLYHEFGKKRMWFYRDDVEAHTSSETTVSY